MNRPTAAPPTFPFFGHRTVAETDKPLSLRAERRRAQLAHVLALKARGLNQTVIGERLNLTPGRISQILSNARKQRAQDLGNRASVNHGERF